ncbi:MAG: lytic transglycosylase domain-containing protein [Chitinophagaceae bacterium]|nr:lytic transglycosylase domain-containing protein [Chitinophagaceae bacterium]
MRLPIIYFSLLTVCCFSLTAEAQQYNPRYVGPDKENASEKPKASAGETFVITQSMPLRVTTPDVPKTFELFGEKMPLELWDIRERFDRELLVNTYMQGSTAYIIKLMARWMPMIEARLKANNVPDDFKYLCIAESALQNQTSRVGAVGFWQFMPGTAPQYGLHIDHEVDERYNPEKATDAACKYLTDAYNKFGNWTAAAASYNCGMGGFNSAMNKQGESSFYKLLLPEETMRYIFRIAALKQILSNPKAAGFFLQDDDVYKPLNVERMTITYGIGDLVQFAKNKGTDYKTLKLLNPWLRDNTFNNAKQREYTILLPGK